MPTRVPVSESHTSAGSALASASTFLSRRQVLRLALATGSLVFVPLALPGCGEEDGSLARLTPTPAPAPSFLTSAEKATLRAAVGRLVPNDATPGAVECGADIYIDRLLAQLPEAAGATAGVFAGGPFSGRNPFANASNGTPSDQFPGNDFDDFIPLTRLQTLSWRVQLLGSGAVAGADFNHAVLGAVVGLRQIYRAGLLSLDNESRSRFGKPFVELDATQQDEALDAIDETFVDQLTAHTLEGMFCPPEYGGNVDRAGWQLIGYDGDSQPLGYAVFDESAQTYRERPDKPLSTANPDEDFAGFGPQTQQFLRFLVRIVGGPHFP